MIKASELRIGNWVNYNSHYRRIVSLNLDTDVNADPIPLSEEILLKCGFSKCDSKFICKPQILTIQISNNETLDYEDGEFFIANSGSHRVVTFWKSPKYLHQLQNLFHSITGDELKFNG